MSEYLKRSRVYKGFHYSVLKPEMIQYLHTKTLEMLRIIIPIFERESIRYFICGGTLLGAVTTGHFIPWDDDIDICVLEDDYDRMIETLLPELPDWMQLQCSQTEPNYYHGWAKVRDKESHVYPDEPLYRYNGVWIDLYKLTLVKEKDVQRLVLQEHLDYLNRRCAVGGLSEQERDKRIAENDLLYKLKAERTNAENNNDVSETYVIWSASKIKVSPVMCTTRKSYSFEGIALQSFNHAEEYLKQHYGNCFADLPPEDARRVGINRITFK